MKSWKDGMYEHEAYYYPLANKVLAFAVVNKTVGDWAAYVDAVQGQNHEEEFEELLERRSSAKLPYDIAKLIFERIDGKYVWRQ